MIRYPFFRQSVLLPKSRVCSDDELDKLQPAVSMIADSQKRLGLVIFSLLEEYELNENGRTPDSGNFLGIR